MSYYCATTSNGRAPANYGGDPCGGPCGGTGRQEALQSTANSEKAAMQCLNDKLADYIRRVLALSSGGKTDPRQYQELVRQLEAESNRLKQMYECELERLRRLLDEAIRDKTDCAANSNKNDYLLTELRNNLEAEKIRRQDAEGKLAQLNDKLNFDNQACEQQVQDLQDKLRIASEIVCSLENQLRQLGQQSGPNMDGLLQKLRDGTASELRRYKTETDAALDRNLDALRRQTDEAAREKDGLARRVRELEECLRQLQARNADLEGQVQSLTQQNADLLRELADERARNEAAIGELERKLACLQEALMCRMREFSEARDIQATLNAEINNYKTLLDSECNRLASMPKMDAVACKTPMFSGTSTAAYGGACRPGSYTTRAASAQSYTPARPPMSPACDELVRANSPYVATRPAPFRPSRPAAWASNPQSKRVTFSYGQAADSNRNCNGVGKRASLPYLASNGTGASGCNKADCTCPPSYDAALTAGRPSGFLSGRRAFAC